MRGGTFIRAALLTLALVAMGLRAATPPGFMFGPSASGAAFTLCTGDGAQADFSHSTHGKQTADTGPCAFAVAAAVAPPPVAASVAFTTASFVVVTTGAPTRVGEGLAAPPPPATGPPLSA